MIILCQWVNKNYIMEGYDKLVIHCAILQSKHNGNSMERHNKSHNFKNFNLQH